MKNLTPLPFDTPGKVYRSAMPNGRFDYEETLMEEYRQAKIDVVVMLVSDEEGKAQAGVDLRKYYAEEGYETIHLPIVDFDVPEDEGALENALQAAIQAVKGEKNIVVHCLAGLGRTGMFLGLLARRTMGMEGAEAIMWLRGFVPGMVQTDAQARVVMEDGGR